MATGDILRVTCTLETPTTDLAQWVWHYRQASGSADEYVDFRTACRNNLITAWANITALIDPAIGMVGLDTAKWDATLKQFDTVRQDVMSTYGTAAGSDPLPHQDAPVVKFFTDLARSIGKKFLIGIVENQVTGSSIDAGAVTNLALWAADFDDVLSGGTSTWEPGNFNTTLERFLPYNQTVEANVLVGSQDRRRPGFGL